MEAMASFEIRRAHQEDAEAILTCLRCAFEAYRHAYTLEAFRDTVLCAETLEHRLQEMAILVIAAESRVVGTVGYQAHGAEGHLRGMAVLPEWQGTGAASMLLHDAERELRRLGCKCVTLDTTEPLQAAIRFYEKHGFRASGKIADFFGMRLYEYSKPLVISAAD
ncbi:MAG: GNAT family N-acetyltransferase [Acidobacteriaceae bacterium]